MVDDQRMTDSGGRFTRMDDLPRQLPDRGLRADRSPARSGGRSIGPRDPCKADGCHKLTNGGKPYCIKHIERMPYVAAMAVKP